MVCQFISTFFFIHFQEFFFFNFSTEYQLDHLNMDSALIYDGVMVFANALRQLGYHQIKPVELDCRDSKSIWQKGYTISNYMKNV